jgi:hypothetical protein
MSSFDSILDKISAGESSKESRTLYNMARNIPIKIATGYRFPVKIRKLRICTDKGLLWILEYKLNWFSKNNKTSPEIIMTTILPNRCF